MRINNINNISKSQIQKMQRIEGAIVKRSLGLSKYASTNKVLCALGIMDLQNALNQSKVRFLGQIMKNEMAAQLITNQLENISNIHEHSFIRNICDILKASDSITSLVHKSKYYLKNLEEQRQLQLQSATSNAIRYLLSNRTNANNTLLLQLVDPYYRGSQDNTV